MEENIRHLINKDKINNLRIIGIPKGKEQGKEKNK